LAINPTKHFISAILKKQVAIWQKLAREKQKKQTRPRFHQLIPKPDNDANQIIALENPIDQ
jgi:hypothetical protein